MKSALGYLAVVVPPDIIDYRTSHDMTIDAGQNITLTCTADGLPEPTIEVSFVNIFFMLESDHADIAEKRRRTPCCLL